MKTNKLTYETSTTFTENGETYKLNVTISLDDSCKNGHCDFSVTGKLLVKASNGIWELNSFGCLHDDIIKHFPDLEMFIQLHLSDYSGTPMFPVDNGMYHLQNYGKETAMNYLRITESEYNILRLADDSKYFKYLIISLGIIDRWKEEANGAIRELERLTGNEWVNPYTDKQDHGEISLTETERAEIERLIAKGYYTNSNIEKREKEAKTARIAKKRADIIERFDEDIAKLETEKLIKLYILDNGIESSNHIYYPSRNEVVFNWLDTTDKISQKEFINFLKRADYSKLPDGITFKMKE